MNFITGDREKMVTVENTADGVEVFEDFDTDPGLPTMESIVIELIPGNPRMHVSPGPPDGNRYSTFDFAQGYVGTEQ